MLNRLLFKIMRALCKLFSGGMNKSYHSDADDILKKFDSEHPHPSLSQQAEIEKHDQIFVRADKSGKTHW